MLWGDGDAERVDLAVRHPCDAAAFDQRLTVEPLGAAQAQGTMANRAEDLAGCVRAGDEIRQFRALHHVIGSAPAAGHKDHVVVVGVEVSDGLGVFEIMHRLLVGHETLVVIAGQRP